MSKNIWQVSNLKSSVRLNLHQDCNRRRWIWREVKSIIIQNLCCFLTASIFTGFPRGSFLRGEKFHSCCFYFDTDFLLLVEDFLPTTSSSGWSFNGRQSWTEENQNAQQAQPKPAPEASRRLAPSRGSQGVHCLGSSPERLTSLWTCWCPNPSQSTLECDWELN